MLRPFCPSGFVAKAVLVAMLVLRTAPAGAAELTSAADYKAAFEAFAEADKRGDANAAEQRLAEMTTYVRAKAGEGHSEFPVLLTLRSEQLLRLGRFEEAEGEARKALVVFEATGGGEQKIMKLALDVLGDIMLSSNRAAEALAPLERALAITASEWGAQHAATAASRIHFASALLALKRLDEAEQQLRRGLDVILKQEPVDASWAASALTNLGHVQFARGNMGDAATLFARAHRQAETLAGKPEPAHAATLKNLAAGWLRLGRPAEAELLLRRALDIERKNYGADHAEIRKTTNLLAVTLLGRGRQAEAGVLFRQIAASAEATFGPTHAETGFAVTNVGLQLWREGKRAEAQTTLRRGWGIIAAQVDEGQPDFTAFRQAILNVLGAAQAKAVMGWE